MFCPKCGAQVVDGARFCPKCGGEIPAQAARTAAAPVNAAGPVQPSVPAAGSASAPEQPSVPAGPTSAPVQSSPAVGSAPAAGSAAPAAGAPVATTAAFTSGEGAFKLLLGIACVPSAILAFNFIGFLFERLKLMVTALNLYSEIQALVGMIVLVNLVVFSAVAILVAPGLLIDVYPGPRLQRSLWIKMGKTQWLGREERTRTLRHLDRMALCAVAVPLLCFAGSLAFDEISLSLRGFDGPLYVVFNSLNSWFANNLLFYLIEVALVLCAVAYAHREQLFPRTAAV